VKVEVEGPKFKFWCDPRASVDERAAAAHAICRYLIDPPQSPKHRRAVAVRQALNLYEGSISGRAKQLERRYRAYLGSGWRHEEHMESLPEPRSTERVLLHRLAKLGAPSSWRQLFDIASAQ
jgi:hypothetical protein